MRFVVSFAILTTLLLAALGCAALVPGYTAEHEQLLAAKQQADAEAASAKAALAEAKKGGDLTAVAEALERRAAAVEAQIDALSKLAQHEVASAAEAAKAAGGLTTGNVLTGGMALLAAALGELARRRATTATSTASAASSEASAATGEALAAKGLAAIATSTVQTVAAGPSRAQPALDQQWDQLAQLRAELAELRGKLSMAATAGAPA